MDMTIEEFCERHKACSEGRKWALKNCASMQEVWERAKPEWVVWIATRQDVLTDKELRLFACWSVRQFWHLLTDDQLKHSVEVAERYARGEATEGELAAANKAAWVALNNIVSGNNYFLARAAARTSRNSWDGAWGAAHDVAGDVVMAVSNLAGEDAGDVVREVQAAYLRTNCRPRLAENEVRKFCNWHEAREEMKRWALKNCASMQEVWERAKPEWVVWIATRQGVLTNKELRLFGCWCALQVWHLLTDDRLKRAIEVAERYARGEATDEELAAARIAAYNAALETGEYADWAAARTTARNASMDVAGAVWIAADDAAESMSAGLPTAEASAVAYDAARAAQAEYLRENCKPRFSAVEGA